jgi:hypothetical protein
MKRVQFSVGIVMESWAIPLAIERESVDVYYYSESLAVGIFCLWFTFYWAK